MEYEKNRSGRRRQKKKREKTILRVPARAPFHTGWTHLGSRGLSASGIAQASLTFILRRDYSVGHEEKARGLGNIFSECLSGNIDNLCPLPVDL
jgi:hypothetical protein